MSRQLSMPPGWGLLGLPHAIVVEFENLARKIICSRFVPVVWLKIAKQRRARALEYRRKISVDKSSFTTKHILNVLRSSSALLAQWPENLLTTLAEAAEFVVFEHRTIIIHAGEFTRPGLPFLLTGMASLLENMPPSELSAGAVGSSGTSSPMKSKNSRKSGHSTRAQQKALQASYAFQNGFPTKTKGLCACRYLQTGSGATSGAGTITAGQCLADYQILSDEHHLHYIVSSGDTTLMTIPRSVFLDAFQKLPVPIAQQIVATSYDKRCVSLPVAFPMTEGRVRVSGLFRDLPPNGIDAVLARLTPKFFPKGTTVCERDRYADEMVFIRRGLVGYRDDMGRKVILRDGACFGEREMVFRERFVHSVIALTNVDVYVLKHADYQTIRGVSAEVRSLLEAAASAQRENELQGSSAGTSEEQQDGASTAINTNHHNQGLVQDSSDHAQVKALQSLVESPSNSADPSTTDILLHGLGQDDKPTSSVGQKESAVAALNSRQNLLLSYVETIPIFNLFASAECKRELIDHLKPRALSSKQLIVCTADHCDRLLILTRGAAVVRTQTARRQTEHYQSMEWIGYTCLLLHRWEHSVVASEPVDLWEIRRDKYVDVLKRHKIYHKVLGGCMQLVQPLLPFPNRCPKLEQAAISVPNPNSFDNLKTPNLHPVSSDDKRRLFPAWRDASEISIFGERPVASPSSSTTKPDGTMKKKRGVGANHVLRGNNTTRIEDPKARKTGAEKTAPKGIGSMVVCEGITKNGEAVLDSSGGDRADGGGDGEEGLHKQQPHGKRDEIGDGSGKGTKSTGVSQAYKYTAIDTADASAAATQNNNDPIMESKSTSESQQQSPSAAAIETDVVGNLVSQPYVFEADIEERRERNKKVQEQMTEKKQRQNASESGPPPLAPVGGTTPQKKPMRPQQPNRKSASQNSGSSAPSVVAPQQPGLNDSSSSTLASTQRSNQAAPDTSMDGTPAGGTRDASPLQQDGMQGGEEDFTHGNDSNTLMYQPTLLRNVENSGSGAASPSRGVNSSDGHHPRQRPATMDGGLLGMSTYYSNEAPANGGPFDDSVKIHSMSSRGRSNDEDDDENEVTEGKLLEKRVEGVSANQRPTPKSARQPSSKVQRHQQQQLAATTSGGRHHSWINSESVETNSQKLSKKQKQRQREAELDKAMSRFQLPGRAPSALSCWSASDSLANTARSEMKLAADQEEQKPAIATTTGGNTKKGKKKKGATSKRTERKPVPPPRFSVSNWSATTVSEAYGGSLLQKSGARRSWGVMSVAVSPRVEAMRYVFEEANRKEQESSATTTAAAGGGAGPQSQPGHQQEEDGGASFTPIPHPPPAHGPATTIHPPRTDGGGHFVPHRPECSSRPTSAKVGPGSRNNNGKY